MKIFNVVTTVMILLSSAAWYFAAFRDDFAFKHSTLEFTVAYCLMLLGFLWSERKTQ